MHLWGRSSFVDLRCVWVTMAGRVDRGLFNSLLSGEMIIDDGDEMGRDDEEEERGWMEEYHGYRVKPYVRKLGITRIFCYVWSSELFAYGRTLRKLKSF